MTPIDRVVTLPRTEQQRVLSDLRGWVWGLCIPVTLLALGFMILPDPTVVKTCITICLVSLQLVVGYVLLQKSTKQARLWLLYSAIWDVNMIIFTSGIAALVGFKLQRLPSLLTFWMLVVGACSLIFILMWKYYTPALGEYLHTDTQTGRFDLQEGMFSLLIPPASLSSMPKNPILKKIVAIIVPSTSIFIALGAVYGVQLGKSSWQWKDVLFGVLAVTTGGILTTALTCIFYTYRFIHRWEKSTGRTMWIKGFEPGSS